ncbi:MAG: heavy-metal-associated domain-containing protein [Candidatus Izimaplasma sp.]|nr:heavy-metal-associated domain-containing protein [Candidatus Izimaplasma bacterium]
MKYELILKIDGIRCGGCFSRIQKEVFSEDVDYYQMNHADYKARILYSDKKDIPEKIIKNIENAGYKVKVISNEEV